MENANRRFIYIFLFVGLVMSSVVILRPFLGSTKNSALDYIEPAAGPYDTEAYPRQDNDSYYYYYLNKNYK